MQQKTHTGLPFMKMHGLGNDFVVLDARAQAVVLTDKLVQGIADRHTGVGFDQLAVIEVSKGAEDAHLIFYNADGSMSGACGNATRCIAQHLMNETDSQVAALTTAFGTLHAKQIEDGRVAVNMGHPLTRWDQIPLSHDVDTDSLPLDGAPSATSMGNPHCTFFVEDADAEVLAEYGMFETHDLFPERTNVQVVSKLRASTLRVRVWERGVGHTLASGSSACAVASAAIRKGFVEGQDVALIMDGGTLNVNWAEDGIWMSGPTAHVFSGQFTQDFLDQFA